MLFRSQKCVRYQVPASKVPVKVPMADAAVSSP
jgi:hypothetical protein